MVGAAAPPGHPLVEVNADVAVAHSGKLSRLNLPAAHELGDGACLLLQVSAKQKGRRHLGSLAEGPSPARHSQLRQELSQRLAERISADEAHSLPPSQLRLELRERLAVLAGASEVALNEASEDDARVPVPSAAPKKSKVALMVLEIIPPCGQLGIDRLYLGSTKTGIAKLLVCICTCLVGGLVWGLVDAVLVILNCLGRDKSIDSLGMVATFTDDEVETAHALAVIGVAIQFLTCCATPSAFSCLRRLVYPDKKPGPLLDGQPSVATNRPALGSSSVHGGGD